jgi:hypothetical protein
MTFNSASADAEDTLMRHVRDAALEGGRAALEELRRNPIVIPEWLDQKTAARYCGFSEQFFNDVCTEGRGPQFVRAGTRVRYRRAWLDAWMENGAHGGNVMTDASTIPFTFASRVKQVSTRPCDERR